MLALLAACRDPEDPRISRFVEAHPAAPALGTDLPVYAVGERISVRFTAAPGTATDWIGLYPADQVRHEGSASWQYTGGAASGAVGFLPPGLPAGRFEARLFPADGYDLAARVAFEVVEPGDGPPPEPAGDLTVMSFNSWLDGTAVPNGVDRIADAVVACDADLVAFQEGGDAFAHRVGAALAERDPAWAHVVSDGADNVLASRLPLRAVAGDGYALHAVLTLPDGERLDVVGTHFDYVRYGPYRARDGADAAAIERSEASVRGDDARRVVRRLEGVGAAVVLGDHNAPSHLDWTPENAAQNFGRVVAWPSSLAFEEAGFVDAYRAVHPDPVADRGFTWSPGYPKGTLDPSDVHDRIDFVYARDGAVRLIPVSADVWAGDPWPSDHRAVVVSYVVAR